MRAGILDIAAPFVVNIDVPDAKAGAAFYGAAFGLSISRMLFGGTVAEMAGGPSPIYLLQKEAGSPPSLGSSERRHFARHWTPVHLDFVVDDLDRALSRALQAGARLEGEVETFDWGRQAVLCDPFGNGVCLVQWRARGYGEVEG